MSPYPPHYAYPSAPPLVRMLPNPPRLHWALVLLFSAVTFGLFGAIWLYVQSRWVRKMRDGKSSGYTWAMVYMIFLGAVLAGGFCLGIFIAFAKPEDAGTLQQGFSALTRLGGFVFYLAAVFTLKGELESNPIGIPLGGVMTFLFGTIYFQYHLHDYMMAEPGGKPMVSGLTEGLGLGSGPVAPIVRSEPGEPPSAQ